MRRFFAVLVCVPVLALMDVLLVNAGLSLAFCVRFGFDLPSKSANLQAFRLALPLISFATVLILYLSDLYANWLRRTRMQLVSSIIAATFLLWVSTMALSFWVRGFAFPRSVLLIAIPIHILLLSAHRNFIWQSYRTQVGRLRLLIVSDDLEACRALASRFRDHGSAWYQTIECVTSADVKEIEQHLSKCDAVAIQTSVAHEADIIANCTKAGKEILVIPDVLDIVVLGAQPQQLDDLLILSIRPPTLSSTQVLLKRVMDVAGAAVALILLSPVLIALFILIPMNSAGRAIFTQERVGRRGTPYRLLKFRTMVDDAERVSGPILASESDPRITPLGRFLRASRLDEVPQLLNVLKGDMSLVGPRPERPFFVEQFENRIPHYALRTALKPGVTGLAQVMGKYSTSAEDKLRFDLMYLHNYSLLQDTKILFQTLQVILQPEQAKGVNAPPGDSLPVTLAAIPVPISQDKSGSSDNARRHAA